MCDRPFGAIFERKVNGMREGGLSFVCARQVHKGELGRRPQIERLRFVREIPRQQMPDVSPVTGLAIKARDRKRGKHGWARLSDVAQLADMPAVEMLERFWPFTHCEEPRLDVIIADDEQDLRTKAIIGASIRLTSQDRLTTRCGSDAQVVWIRQGLALTILYLRHFGYTPDLPTLTDLVDETNPPL